MKTLRFCMALACGFAFVSFAGCRQRSGATASRGETGQSVRNQQNWASYGGSPHQDHYSPLSQINRRNVSQLKEVWRYDTKEGGGLEASPLVVDGVLYGVTPNQEVFALDAAAGKRIWEFKSGLIAQQPNRGLAYWSDGNGNARILAGVMNYVYALDAKTGHIIRSFGDNGRIDLRDNLGRDPKLQSIALTSPGIVYKDLIIVGGREPESLPAPPGDIRAYDVRTGKLRWTFHTIPHPGEYGYDTWPKDAWTYSGGANCWGGMALDPKRGIVYVPTGSAAPDFYGASRIGDDLFADTLIALDAETGTRIWSFQGVRHDMWDRDFPAPPALLTVKRDGKEVPAVAQTTKQGFLFLFNRVNGKPLFPIEYRKVPASTVPGEVAAKEQPFPLEPAPYTRQKLTADMLSHRTPEVYRQALARFRQARSDGQFVPLSVGKPTILFPGTDGGGEWGGPAVDPETGILYVNANEDAAIDTMAKAQNAPGGRGVYLSQCSVCHGKDLTGNPPTVPSLVDIGTRMTDPQMASQIQHGGGRMPAFPNIRGDELKALLYFLNRRTGHDFYSIGKSSHPETYQVNGYKWFHDADGYPAISPPWGTLSAINLNTGKYVWKIPFGQYPKLAAEGMPDTGSANYGGPIVTAGGLLFIGATDFDDKFRAYDKSTGKLLWQTTLPFPGNATPATYMVNGRQYVVIASGGGKLVDRPSGGVYIAFALPKSK